MIFNEKSMKIYEFQWKIIKINGIQWFSIENYWKSMEFKDFQTKIIENKWFSTENQWKWIEFNDLQLNITENQWFSIENQWKSIEFHNFQLEINRRRSLVKAIKGHGGHGCHSPRNKARALHGQMENQWKFNEHLVLFTNSMIFK